MRYALVIEAPSNFAAYVPDLPGCVAAGASVQETETLVREAIAFTWKASKQMVFPLLYPVAKLNTSTFPLEIHYTRFSLVTRCDTLRACQKPGVQQQLVPLPAYLGTNSIDEAVKTVRGQRILWLEILVNEDLDLSTWSSEPAVQQAYQTACRWFTHYRRLLTSLLDRTPLPADHGPIDYRDYRAFAEALSLVCAHR